MDPTSSHVPPGARKWPCAICGGQRTPEGYDPCIGWLPGAQHVCCGHGVDERRYVITLDGRRFDGLQAFQSWNRWQHTTHGRAVVTLDRHSTLFGWRMWNAGRHPCTICALARYECSCPQPAFGVAA